MSKSSSNMRRDILCRMSITRKDVEHVARLARLALGDDEIAAFEEQLSKILDHAERVTQLDTEGIPPTSSAIPLANVFRADELQESLTNDQALANAPEPESG